jgi:isocitrate dehydrogenase
VEVGKGGEEEKGVKGRNGLKVGRNLANEDIAGESEHGGVNKHAGHSAHGCEPVVYGYDRE